jgi:hypothetical protein
VLYRPVWSEFSDTGRRGDWSDNDIMWSDYPDVKEALNPVWRLIGHVV